MKTNPLTEYAEKLIAAAEQAMILSAELESMPDPIGNAIADVVAILARHGLCVIERSALKMISDYAIECKLDGESWPAGMYASSAAASDALTRVFP